MATNEENINKFTFIAQKKIMELLQCPPTTVPSPPPQTSYNIPATTTALASLIQPPPPSYTDVSSSLELLQDHLDGVTDTLGFDMSEYIHTSPPKKKSKLEELSSGLTTLPDFSFDSIAKVLPPNHPLLMAVERATPKEREALLALMVQTCTTPSVGDSSSLSSLNNVESPELTGIGTNNLVNLDLENNLGLDGDDQTENDEFSKIFDIL